MGAPASPQIVGRYGIYGKIASGGMASVHFGRLLGAAGFSRTVAIKRLHAHLAEDPQFLSTMIDEARLAARIHHPNVVPTLDVVAVHGELLVIMEYIRGESLARLLQGESTRNRRVPHPIASAIAIGALHGLHAAHEATSDRGDPLAIVHRDVSPQNILVGVDGVARVIDFGVAKAAGRLQTTSAGSVKGKVAYMAPEQLAAGDARIAVGEVTRATDIYAMGVVLWEMLAGKRLFSGDHDANLILQVLVGAKDPPSRHTRDLPAPLDALVMKALALDPANRFASAKEMAEAMREVVQPAFPTDVGRWVEDVASDALARRGAQLADIERISEAMTVPPAADDHAVEPRRRASSDDTLANAVVDDALTILSQPSSLSIETPSRGTGHSTRPPRGLFVSAGASALIAVGVAAFFARGWMSHRSALVPAAEIGALRVDASVFTVPASAEPPEGPAKPSSPKESLAPLVELTQSSSPAASSPPPPSAPAARVAPAKPRSKPHAPPVKPAPFRFSQPD